MIRKVQKEHVPEIESERKTRSNFRALFYRVSRAFGCDQNAHVALETGDARRSKEKCSICHDYPLVCPCFFATRFILLFRSQFCRNCSFIRRYQHDSVLELFPHFGGGLFNFFTTWSISMKLCTLVHHAHGYKTMPFLPSYLVMVFQSRKNGLKLSLNFERP